MERELPRTGLHGSALVGLLAELQLAFVDRPATPPSFVEGLGRWLGWKEAIPLSAVLQAPLGPAARGRAPTAAAALEREFSRVHTALGQAIDDDRATADDDGRDFQPFRRRCFSLQQAMDATISPLRAQLRATVARLSPQMAQLAALDAVMANALAPREQAQLAQIPVLLDRHFTRLRHAHAGPDQDSPWLDTFRQDMRRLLLAERDLRLQPARGLLDTLRGTPQGLHE